MSRLATSLLLLATVLAASGCSIPVQVPPADKLTDAQHGSVIIVGRVELDPPLDDKDQILESIGSGRQRKKLYINITPKLVKEDDAPMIGPEFIEETMGEFFFVKRVPKATYVQDMMIYTSITGNRWEYVKLPGGLRVDLRDDDRAVYIGTLRFTRNEYFDITKAQIIDDYAGANAAFKKKFGAHFNLRNSVVIPERLPK